jgi:ribosomal protein S19
MKGFKLGEFILTKKIETQTHLKKKVQKKTKGKK